MKMRIGEGIKMVDGYTKSILDDLYKLTLLHYQNLRDASSIKDAVTRDLSQLFDLTHLTAKENFLRRMLLASVIGGIIYYFLPLNLINNQTAYLSVAVTSTACLSILYANRCVLPITVVGVASLILISFLYAEYFLEPALLCVFILLLYLVSKRRSIRRS
jgi:hypothetical protein